MEDPAAEPSSSSDDFWLLVAALKRFVASEGNGSLPLEVSSKTAGPWLCSRAAWEGIACQGVNLVLC